MTEQSTPNAESSPERIDDIFTLILADGLKATSDGKELRYRVVRLRETDVADERMAERLSERAIMAGGSWKLMVSESNFKHTMNMLHIESFECDGLSIPRAMINLDLYDKLSHHDLELIEQRIFLLTMSAELRYGNLSQTEFDNVMSGLGQSRIAPSPQPSGQASGVGATAERPESGPSLLADFTGDGAKGQAQVVDTPAV